MKGHQPTADRPRRRPLDVAVPVALGAALLWAAWPSLREMVERWGHDPRYSHGFLVPAFAAFLLWHRRGMVAAAEPAPSWWGLPLVAFGEAVGFAGTLLYNGWLEGVSLLPTLAGLCLVAGGRDVLRYAWPAIGFLLFMIPLPYRLEQAFGAHLQRVATLASNYLLQAMGLPAVAEGNVILLGETRIGVVDACNGLGMLFTFFAFAVAVALLIRRGPGDKLVIVLSAIPIAMLANVLRITATGLLHETAGHGVADAVYHDLAGWLMMPLALAAFCAELALLSRLFVEVSAEAPSPSGGFLREAGLGLTTDPRGRRRG